jgi:hypothetical protein
VACPRRWLIVSLTACSCAVAGCGSAERAAPPPRLPHELAQRLAHEADALRTRKLALRLQREVVAAINAGRVPAALQEELQSRANAVVDRPSRARAFAAWLRAHARQTPTGSASGSEAPIVMPSRASASWTSSRAL